MTIDDYPIIEWADKIHKTAKEKGFWEASTNIDTKMMLIISELAEAVEADRKDRRAEHSNFEHLYLERCSVTSCARYKKEGIQFITLEDPRVFNQLFEQYIKDTIEDEVADAFIRILDLLAWFSQNFSLGMTRLPMAIKEASSMEFRETFPANCYHLSVSININSLDSAAKRLIELADFHGIDLKTHVELKILYNSTREKLHGKNY